jgi:hypothetical protein
VIPFRYGPLHRPGLTAVCGPTSWIWVLETGNAPAGVTEPTMYAVLRGLVPSPEVTTWPAAL